MGKNKTWDELPFEDQQSIYRKKTGSIIVPDKLTNWEKNNLVKEVNNDKDNDSKKK